MDDMATSKLLLASHVFNAPKQSPSLKLLTWFVICQTLKQSVSAVNVTDD